MANVSSPSHVSRVAPGAIASIIVLALLAVGLNIYQWVELVKLRTSGGTLMCSFNATFDCAGVWNSPLASGVHDVTGIPIVGWGLAWSAALLVLSARLYVQSRKNAVTGEAVAAVRLGAGLGVVVCLLLLAYSVMIKVFCPTCIAFYVLVAAIAFAAFTRMGGVARDWGQSGMLTGGLMLILLAALLYPGLHTPRENLITADLANVPVDARAGAASAASPLEKFLGSLSQEVRQATSDALDDYHKASVLVVPPDPARITYGTADAPVHIVEWTDIRCPHCRHLEDALAGIRTNAPPGSWSEESRHFPLEVTCNPEVQRPGDGTSCLAAKLQICLIGSPEFGRVRAAMFEQQATLNKDNIWAIATSDPARRKALEDCVNSKDTAATLSKDIALAAKYKIEGTPLVVINGRKGAPIPAFLMALVMAKGNDNDPAFLSLPAPQPPEPQ